MYWSTSFQLRSSCHAARPPPQGELPFEDGAPGFEPDPLTPDDLLACAALGTPPLGAHAPDAPDHAASALALVGSDADAPSHA